jgi:signal transduction histidine kinase
MSGSPPTAGVPPDGADAPGLGKVSNAALLGRVQEAERALLARPRLSIRTRLVISLLLCFGLSCVFALAIMSILVTAHRSLSTLASADRLSYEIHNAVDEPRDRQQSARETALAHADAAIAALYSETSGMRRVAPIPGIDSIATRLRVYRDALAALPAEPSPEDLARLQASGAALAREVDAMIAAERESLESEFRTGRRTMALFLALLLILFFFITYFFARALVMPIRRFQRHTKRIAQGDFSLIGPARAFRDEFTDLALAVNRMLAELQVYQDRCVRAGKLTAVGTITSGIAHEINNPLNNVSITTETLMAELDQLPREEQWKLLQDIYFETERASEIVKSLLDFTRDERQELVSLDLAEVIQSTHRLAQNELALNNVEFVNLVPAGLPHVRATANQLRQVFLNLFINAVQAMPLGGKLTVTADARSEEARVCVEVRDEGEGIPASVLPHIFDPFFTTKGPGQGTGLGLSVSWSILRKFGGEIQATSEPGKGSVFHVCLPAVTVG